MSLTVLVAAVYLTMTLAGTARYNALQPVKAGAGAGAKLPISYSSSTLTGTIRYASPTGSTTSSCTSPNDPCTLSRAVSQITSANSTVVLAGGTYRGQRNITISGSGKDGLRIIAASGQIPDIRGSVEASGGWTTEGSYKYRSYTPRPLRGGGGVDFDIPSNMSNLLGDGVGRYADQVWIGANPLKQVLSKSTLQDGKFYVDSANNRLYLTANDAGKAAIETSRPGDGTSTDRDRLFQVFSKRVTFEGIRISRFSPNANDYGVITLEAGSNNFTANNIEVSDLPYDGIHSGENDNVTIKNTTVSRVAWQSIEANQTDNFTMDSVKITDADIFDEFKSSPASGALKTGRTRATKVFNSYIANNKSHGLWFDQSNINVVAVNNHIENNIGAGLFFEISDGLTMANNYIAAPAQGSGQAVKLAGSSGLRLVNNTIIGGVDPIGLYMDGRSRPGCAENKANCGGEESPSSDRQGRFASSIGSTMDWMPRIDVMVNNIIAYPRTGSGSLCGSSQSVGMCITLSNSSASTTIDKIIHKADPTRGIPQTIMDGNVYANGTSRIIRDGKTDYTAISDWTKALAGSPVGIAGLDAKGKSGNSWVNTDGTGTDSLVNANTQAYKIPAFTGTNAIINTYVPAGTQQYGALSDAAGSPPPTTTVTPPTPPPTTTVTPPTPPPDVTAPDGPNSLSASAISTSRIDLSWRAATDAVGVTTYILTRNGTQIYSGTALNFSDTGLTASTKYNYKVVARDAAGNTSTGTTTSATTQATPTPTTPPPPPPPTVDNIAPSAPSSVKASVSFDTLKFSYYNNLRWSSSYDLVGVSNYLIKRNGTQIGTSATTSYRDYGISANTPYTYEIYAQDAAGNISKPGSTKLVGRCFLIWCWAE